MGASRGRAGARSGGNVATLGYGFALGFGPGGGNVASHATSESSATRSSGAYLLGRSTGGGNSTTLALVGAA